MGHNFGMSHDFDAKHGGKGSACDGTGIMSYNSDKPMRWSTCSVNDFTGYYNSKKWGTTCLKSRLFSLNISLRFRIFVKIYHSNVLFPSRLAKVCRTMRKQVPRLWNATPNFLR